MSHVLSLKSYVHQITKHFKTQNNQASLATVGLEGKGSGDGVCFLSSSRFLQKGERKTTLRMCRGYERSHGHSGNKTEEI